MKKTSTLPDQILEKFDDLQFEQVTAAELNNFTITGIDGEGLGCITLCGLYPLWEHSCMCSTSIRMKKVHSCSFREQWSIERRDRE